MTARRDAPDPGWLSACDEDRDEDRRRDHTDRYLIGVAIFWAALILGLIFLAAGITGH